MSRRSCSLRSCGPPHALRRGFWGLPEYGTKADFGQGTANARASGRSILVLFFILPFTGTRARLKGLPYHHHPQSHLD